MNTPAYAASYVHGGGGPPLQGITVSGVLDAAARRWPESGALVVVDQGIRWSWRELRDRALRLGAGLLASGLRPGERIGVLAPNRAEWLLAQFGTACAGLVLVNINPACRTGEREYALNKVGCRAMVTETAFRSSDYLAMLRELALAAADEIREYCRGRLAHFKIPRYVVFIDAFPLTVTGKVQMFVLRQQLAEELGLGNTKQIKTGV